MAVTVALCPLAEAQEVTPAEAHAIVKEAYLYGYPLVGSYCVQYAYFVDKRDKSFDAPWNVIKTDHQRLHLQLRY